ncbi:hypothetical protein FALCPG4_010906 [Fusarium falciforme]
MEASCQERLLFCCLFSSCLLNLRLSYESALFTYEEVDINNDNPQVNSTTNNDTSQAAFTFKPFVQMPRQCTLKAHHSPTASTASSAPTGRPHRLGSDASLHVPREPAPLRASPPPPTPVSSPAD